MDFNRESRTVAAGVITMAHFNRAFLSLNGLFMIIAPFAWYELVPGVPDTGFFNQHFVRDIGMIQLFLGIVFAIGLAVPECRVLTVWALPQLPAQGPVAIPDRPGFQQSEVGA